MTTAGSSAHIRPKAVINLSLDEEYESLSLWQLALRRIRHDYLTLARSDHPGDPVAAGAGHLQMLWM